MTARPGKPLVQLPKDALSRVWLGDIFAERDQVLLQKDVFVRTQASAAVLDGSAHKIFFVEKHYYDHIKRVAADKNGGVVLLLNDKDIRVFLRQARASKSREDHIQDRYSATSRAIS